MKKMKNLKSIENPLFLSSRMYQYGNFWVINGFSFTADSEKKYALYQEVSVFGSLCRDCKIHANWKFFQIDNNGIFKEVGNYFDHELLNTESLELTSEEVDMIQKYSQQNSLCPVDAKSLVSTKLTPFVEQKTAFVKIKFAKIIEFNEGELVEFIKEVNDLLHELKDLYPLSYVKLVSIKAEIKNCLYIIVINFINILKLELSHLSFSLSCFSFCCFLPSYQE